MEPRRVFTIGHSTLSLDAFISALTRNDVDAVADVRSAPFSRFNPAFNRQALKRDLKECGIHYVFLGKELGGRPEDPACYENGRASYTRMAQTDLFRSGLDRVIQGSTAHRIALMCSEADPLNCHRTLLVAKALSERGLSVLHIDRDGQAVSHEETEATLMRITGSVESLLRTHAEALAAAYETQSQRIAYAERHGATPAEAI